MHFYSQDLNYNTPTIGFVIIFSTTFDITSCCQDYTDYIPSLHFEQSDCQGQLIDKMFEEKTTTGSLLTGQCTKDLQHAAH